MKDNFSQQAGLYAKYRPAYPPKLINYLVALTNRNNLAWDCGTGNGQVAAMLSPHFKEVIATDMSEQQLKYAQKAGNIIYRKESAENSSLPDESADLITTAQAVHWFDFELFYKEVNRVLKKNGVFALFGYGLIKVNPEADKLIHHFYHNIVGNFWDEERRYIDENYQTLPFPFKEIVTPQFQVVKLWGLREITGYLRSWSAVQHYLKNNQKDPVDLIEEKLKLLWPGSGKAEVTFDVLLRVGMKE